MKESQPAIAVSLATSLVAAPYETFAITTTINKVAQRRHSTGSQITPKLEVNLFHR